MNLITGSRAALTPFPRQRTLLFSTRILPTTPRDTLIFTPTALGLPAEASDMDGAPLAPALAGHPSPWANGCGIPVSAGLLPATNLGVGLLTTMAAGFLMPLVADGFIRRPPFMDSEAMEVSQESVFRP